MKIFTLATFMVATLFIGGCDKSEDSGSFNGTYKGIFELTNSDPTVDFMPLKGDVSVTLSGKGYQSTANSNYAPAGGQGTYTAKRNEIVFTDTLFRTANFDWNLVLNGSYKVTRKADSVHLVKKIGYNSYTYKLAKQHN